jgi:hypothetical protein
VGGEEPEEPPSDDEEYEQEEILPYTRSRYSKSVAGADEDTLTIQFLNEYDLDT